MTSCRNNPWAGAAWPAVWRFFWSRTQCNQSAVSVCRPTLTTADYHRSVTSPTRVALALGGGGARGYAHIGVIQVLEEQGFEIVGISGTSIGALVGGVYAAGHLEAYTEWVTSLNPRDVIRLLDPSLRSPGAIKGHRVMARVKELLEEIRIEDLPMPYTAVATDLLNRKEVWFQEGSLTMAIRASIALPSVITPVMLNGRLLADGVLTNPVPIAPLSGLDADLVVAVDLSGLPTASGGPSIKQKIRDSAEPRPTAEWQDRLRRTASQVMDNETARKVTQWLATRRHENEDEGTSDEEAEAMAEEIIASPGFDDLPSALGMLDVMELSLDVLQSVVSRYRLASYPPDVMITMPKNISKTLEFHRGAELIGRLHVIRECLHDGAAPGREI